MKQDIPSANVDIGELDVSIDSDEKEFTENISWDTESDEEDLDLDEEKKMGYDPNAINQYLPDLVRLVYGSFEPKHKILDEFNEVHPDCSKNSIEKKLKDFFIKDKRGEDPRQRYYANDEILSQLT